MVAGGEHRRRWRASSRKPRGENRPAGRQAASPGGCGTRGGRRRRWRRGWCRTQQRACSPTVALPAAPATRLPPPRPSLFRPPPAPSLPGPPPPLTSPPRPPPPLHCRKGEGGVLGDGGGLVVAFMRATAPPPQILTGGATTVGPGGIVPTRGYGCRGPRRRR